MGQHPCVGAAQEVEEVLEAAWEALEMAVALYAKQDGANLEQVTTSGVAVDIIKYKL